MQQGFRCLSKSNAAEQVNFQVLKLKVSVRNVNPITLILSIIVSGTDIQQLLYNFANKQVNKPGSHQVVNICKNECSDRKLLMVKLSSVYGAFLRITVSPLVKATVTIKNLHIIRPNSTKLSCR